MPEFRTRPPGGESEENSGGNSGIESMLNEVVENIQESPQLQAQVAQAMQQSGLNPQLLKAVAPEIEVPAEDRAASPDVSQRDAGADITSSVGHSDDSPPAKTDGGDTKPSPEDIEALLDDIISYTGEDWTLAELKDFTSNNPDVIKTAIDMGF